MKSIQKVENKKAHFRIYILAMVVFQCIIWWRFINIYVGGVCNVLSSVLLQKEFEVTDRSVLQLSIIWQAKENTFWRHEGGPAQKPEENRSPRLYFDSSLYLVFLLLLSLPSGNWISQEGFCFTPGPHSSPQAFFCSIFAGFSLLCL